MVSTPIGYAQTNIQIYNQMKTLGYESRDIERVRRAYGLAMRIFAGQFRANEKPQLAHLVGVASVLAAQRAEAAIVAAGMLHTAYSHGEWGDAGRGRTEAKAQQIREVAGEQAEALIACYQGKRFTPDRIRDLRSRLDELSGLERDALLMDLADVLEEFDDGSIEYCDHVKHETESGDRDAVFYLTADTAAALGYPDLARAFEAALRRLESFEAPAPAHTHRRNGSCVPPLTYTLHPRIALKQRWRKSIKKLRRRVRLR